MLGNGRSGVAAFARMECMPKLMSFGFVAWREVSPKYPVVGVSVRKIACLLSASGLFQLQRTGKRWAGRKKGSHKSSCDQDRYKTYEQK
jgi:hypothetical protein